MTLMTCPSCGACGPGGRAETAFDYIERDELLEIRRCRSCGAGLLVRFTVLPTDAEAEVIPPEVWAEIAARRGLAAP